MSPYTTAHVATLFAVSKATIRNWSNEFAEYLSPTTQPGKNKNRFYTVSDLEVLALVTELKRQGILYAEVHAALKNGQRGKAPDLPPQDLQMLSASEGQRRLTLEVDQLQRLAIRLRDELTKAQQEAASARELQLDKVRLETELATTQRQLEEAKQDLELTRKQNMDLSKQLGHEYVRGVMDTLREKGDLPKKE